MPSVKKSETVEIKKQNPLANILAKLPKRKTNKSVEKKDRSLLWGKIGFALGLAGIGFWLSGASHLYSRHSLQSSRSSR